MPGGRERLLVWFFRLLGLSSQGDKGACTWLLSSASSGHQGYGPAWEASNGEQTSSLSGSEAAKSVQRRKVGTASAYRTGRCRHLRACQGVWMQSVTGCRHQGGHAPLKMVASNKA